MTERKIKGVYRQKDALDGTQRWRAAIRAQGKWLHLGIFPSEQQADDAFVLADTRLRKSWGQLTPLQRAEQRVASVASTITTTQRPEQGG